MPDSKSYGSQLKRGKELFFQYDGSQFYMSRDGCDREYRGLSVPRKTEAEWLDQLLQSYLSKLPENGNWRTVNFLEHHSLFQYLERLLTVEPRGELWECCAYLEILLVFAKGDLNHGSLRRRRLVTDVVNRVPAYVDERCIALARRCRSARVSDRIEKISQDAKRLFVSC